jgi:hypothetical protein
MLPVDGNALADRIIDLAPQLLSQIHAIFKREDYPPGTSVHVSTQPPPNTAPPTP